MPRNPNRPAAELANERALARGVYESMTQAMGHPPAVRRPYAGLAVASAWLFVAGIFIVLLAIACS